MELERDGSRGTVRLYISERRERRVHTGRPANAVVDGRALAEDGLRGVKGLAGIEDDQADAAGAVARVDQGHASWGLKGRQMYAP